MMDKKDKRLQNEGSTGNKKLLIKTVIFCIIGIILVIYLYNNYLDSGNKSCIILMLPVLFWIIFYICWCIKSFSQKKLVLLKRKDFIKEFEGAKMFYETNLEDSLLLPVWILSFLNNLKKKINKYAYESDNKFLLHNQLDFFKNEINNYLNNNDMVSAIIVLENYVKVNFEIQGDENMSSTMNEYYQIGIICNEEKNDIMELINIIEAYAEKSMSNIPQNEKMKKYIDNYIQK